MTLKMTQKNTAGKSTRIMARKRRSSALWITLLGIAALLAVWVIFTKSNTLGIGGISTLVSLILILVLPNFIKGLMRRKFNQMDRAVHGARGEEQIGAMLDRLSTDFFVLHDIECPYGNIDHIVISKYQGLFMIETKSHWGKVETLGDKIMVNGKPPEKDFIAQALKNAYWLKDMVGKIIGQTPWITPIIVFTNAFVPPTKPIKGIHIINKKYLSALLQRNIGSNTLHTQIWEEKDEIMNRLKQE